MQRNENGNYLGLKTLFAGKITQNFPDFLLTIVLNFKEFFQIFDQVYQTCIFLRENRGVFLQIVR